MLSVQKRSQKKTSPSRSRSYENSIDYSDSDNEGVTDKTKRMRNKGFKSEDKNSKKISLKSVKKEYDSDFGDEENYTGRDDKIRKSSSHKYSLRTPQPSTKRAKLDNTDPADEESEDSSFYGSIYDGVETSVARSRISKRHKVIVVHEDSDESDSDIDQSEITVGHDYAVRGTENEIWVGRVTKAEDEGFSVQWFEELRAYPGHYALLPWYASVPSSSVIRELKLECDNSTGMWKLKTELPAFKIYQP